jgi:ectoine hydroxylase-related dioxygenase (phytanoyl-CoA dioxygenase family)
MGNLGRTIKKKVILIKKNNSSKKIKIIKNKFKEMKEKEGRKEGEKGSRNSPRKASHGHDTFRNVDGPYHPPLLRCHSIQRITAAAVVP